MQDRTVVAAKAKIGSDPLLLVDRSQAGVALVTLNRPDTRNSLSLEMIDRLHARFTRLVLRPHLLGHRARRQRPGVLRRP